VCSRLSALARAAEEAGIDRGGIVVDPGIDLGKSWQQSLRLLGRLTDIAALGFPLLLAVSNKIFLRRALGLGDEALDVATAAACALGAMRGGSVVRVHDARIGRQAADLAYALRAAGSSPAR
jgi:dihydropteroate synthase